MRFFLELSYLGTNYCGWQRQPNDSTVQQTIEDALTKILREEIQIVGCGRTDTGVHAAQYFAHFDCTKPLSERFLFAINAVLPKDIALQAVHPVSDEAHARFDATRRAYVYYLEIRKNPFTQQVAWQYPQGRRLTLDALQAAADILLQYEDFYTFCKSDNEHNTYKVTLEEAHWAWDAAGQRFVFHIVGNRFLRGMVRLVVGACVQIAEGKITLEELKNALDHQVLLSKPRSVPAEGLFLSKIVYPYL